MPRRESSNDLAGQILRCRHGHFGWGDFELYRLADGSFALRVPCDLPVPEGLPGGHFLRPVSASADRNGSHRAYDVSLEPHGWPTAVQAFSARDAFAEQERKDSRRV